MAGKKTLFPMLLGILALLGLYLTKLYSYLLFHSLAEMFSVVVACSIFALAWNSRRFMDNAYLFFLGIAYLFIGGLDVIHTLGYTGMGVFQGYGSNLPTQLWIGARYIEAFSFLVAPLFLGRKLKVNLVFLAYSVVTCLLLASVFYWDIFPVCFDEETGLTSFKKLSEYMICLILLASILTLFQRRPHFDTAVFRLLLASIILTIASELSFTLYTHVYALPNLIGHYLKVVSFYFVYKAIIATGLMRPYALLFRNLKQSEEHLRKARDELEERVAERTSELARSNEELRLEIEQRGLAEAKLREAEFRFRTVANFAYDWEYWEGPDGAFQYNSPSCQRITGYRAEEFVQNPGLLREIILEEDRDIWDEHRDDAFKEKKQREVQFRIRRQDGEIRWIEHACQPVTDDQGTFLGFRSSNRDITARMEAQEEARRHREELSHVSRVAMLGELTASLAHELNQPLAGIVSNAQAARRFLSRNIPDLDEVRDSLEDIIEDGKRAGEVIHRLRALLKKSISHHHPLNVNDVIREVITLARSDMVIKNVPIRTELSSDLPSVSGDRIQLQQVMLNLILNGAEAMMNLSPDQRELLIRTTRSETGMLTVSVRDSGIGLKDEDIERMFEPFYTDKPEGMGMGLSICSSIIKAHGGRLWATDNADRGATFHFTLPVYDEASK